MWRDLLAASPTGRMISAIRSRPSASMASGVDATVNSASATRPTVGPVDWADISTVTSSR